MNDKRFLSITAVLVVLLGVPSVHSVLSEPAKVKAATRAPASTVASLDSSSEEEMEPALNPIKAKSVTLNLPCNGVDQDHQIDGTLLRLKYDSCKDQVLKNVTVVNLSNGFTASVIGLGGKNSGKGFTTDFMDLKEGENTLDILASTEEGEAVHRTFKVTRLPASVN